MEKHPKILFIDFCNFEDYPIGGYLTFAKNLMESFKNDLALVGITTQVSDPIGKWFKKDINGIIYDFFAIAKYNKSKTKHLIPDRLISFLLTTYYHKIIYKIDFKNVFIQRQEILLSSTNLKTINSCFCFAGLENPLNISKYWFAKPVANLFEKIFFEKLNQVTAILASGIITPFVRTIFL